MGRPQNPNMEIMQLAVAQLGDLVNEMVFLGGCATGLLTKVSEFRKTE